jgi:hypothetical protein
MQRLIVFCIGLVFTLGCVPLLVGTGIVTGYVLSNDSAIGNVKIEYRTLWDLCIEKLQDMEAQILETNESKGIIKAKIYENNITIRIDSISSKTQRLKIAVRKYFLPQPQFAQKIFFKILEELE